MLPLEQVFSVCCSSRAATECQWASGYSCAAVTASVCPCSHVALQTPIGTLDNSFEAWVLARSSFSPSLPFGLEFCRWKGGAPYGMWIFILKWIACIYSLLGLWVEAAQSASDSSQHGQGVCCSILVVLQTVLTFKEWVFPETQSALITIGGGVIYCVQTLHCVLSYALSDWTLLKGRAEIIKFLEKLNIASGQCRGYHMMGGQWWLGNI